MLSPCQLLIKDYTKEFSLFAQCDRHSSEFDGHFLPYGLAVGKDHEGHLFRTELETVVFHVCFG